MERVGNIMATSASRVTTVRVSSIAWDTEVDGEEATPEAKLPTVEYVAVYVEPKDFRHDVVDRVFNHLSNKHGWLIRSCVVDIPGMPEETGDED